MPTKKHQELEFDRLLALHPPGTIAIVPGLAEELTGFGASIHYHIRSPELQLHCSASTCNGTRFFRCEESESQLILSDRADSYPLLQYLCANCEGERKIFSLQVSQVDIVSKDCVVQKLGEIPPFGPPIPAKLVSLIGAERDNFLKGRRCENQNLGIGAFSYYRRVVEMQRTRIFDAIIAAAVKLNMGSGELDMLRAASAETQFSKSLEMAKNVMPDRLLVQGHSPLKLLHAALSHGVHNMTDEECLEHAESVRVVLGELAESLDRVRKDEAELTKAVSTLLRVRK